MNEVNVALGLIARDGRWFLQRRDPANPVLAGRWEFPGGKVEAPEAPREALLRELEEELAWRPERLEALPVLRHEYAQRIVLLHPFRCSGPGRPATELAWGWFTVSEMRGLPIPEANLPLLAWLREPA